MPQHNKNELLFDIQGLKKTFPVTGSLFSKKREVKAVNNISLQLYKGETLGLVGESGCGKSTTGRSILRLLEPSAGTAIYKGEDVFKMNEKSFLKVRKEIQMVFQDPYSSLNPRKRIGKILEETLLIHSIGVPKERKGIVMNILDKVGLNLESYYKYPHEFSGGQRQRIGLARALIMEPEIIILDEPVSALDVSIQSQIINLLKKNQTEYNLTYLFISHDISVVRHVSDRIAVMYLGNIVEEAETDLLFSNPLHPYTKSLLEAIPKPSYHNNKNKREILKGEVPSPLDPPKGCVFHTRCPSVMDICKNVVPNKTEMSSGHVVNCHLYE